MRRAEVGLFLIIIGLPLVFAPFSADPFADIKLVVLLVGTLMLSAARLEIDRPVAIAATLWAAAVAIAALLGLDPIWSLLGPENQASGAVLLATSALLACLMTGIDEDLRRRVPVWFFWSGVLVSTLAILGRFVDVGGAGWELGRLSSTLGHRVFAGGLVAAALVAATRVPRTWVTYVGLVALGSGIAVTAVRSAWIGAVIGLALVATVDGPARRSVAAVLIPVVLVVAGWTIADRATPDKELAYSAVPRFAQVTEGSATERIPALRSLLRAWRDDPIIGSGPGTSWNAYLSHATTKEIGVSGRAFGDAHNIVVESAVTTGTIGVACLMALAGTILWRSRNTGSERRWALGAAAALGVVHLFQPLNVVITPLLFVTAGLAVSTSERRRGARIVPTVLVALALILALLRFGASSFERYGTTYASAESLRWALRLEPRRIGAAFDLAEHRAFDHGAGDRAAAAEVLQLARDTIREHSWHPGVRLEAANAVALVGQEAAARAFLDDHLRLFPHDPLALAGAAVLELRVEHFNAAERLAREALAIDPEQGLAESVLEQVREHRGR